jgi:hypothetical protein
MPVSFEPVGPFEIPITKERSGRLINEQGFADFWSRSGISEKVGCYIFAMKSKSSNYTPWYVGKTTRNFQSECFTERNILKYTRVLARTTGTPCMLFICEVRKKGPKNTTEIGNLEVDLINQAFQVNRDIQNDRGIDEPRYLIKGLGVPGKPSKAIQAYRSLLAL